MTTKLDEIEKRAQAEFAASPLSAVRFLLAVLARVQAELGASRNPKLGASLLRRAKDAEAQLARAEAAIDPVRHIALQDMQRHHLEQITERIRAYFATTSAAEAQPASTHEAQGTCEDCGDTGVVGGGYVGSAGGQYACDCQCALAAPESEAK